jgi:DNA-binding LytR/AlgR family response regulator
MSQTEVTDGIALEVRTALITWLLFLAGTCAYCLTYQAVVWAVTPDVGRTVSLALREWGGWLVVTPLVFAALTRSVQRSGRLQFRAGMAALAIAAATLLPVVADLVTHTRDVAASLAIFLPRNVLAFVVVCLVWKVFVRRADVPVIDTAPSAPLPDALLVSKGADECLVSVERVQRLSAAGNYVEVHAGGQLYLMRATLAQAEARLPGGRFVRVHRSHVVGVDEIERIRVNRSGSGVVTLRDGSVLPMSKRYRAALQRLRATAA